ncbi:MAG: amidohydrolase family protein [Candidatus Dormiibacterota bacterium]
MSRLDLGVVNGILVDEVGERPADLGVSDGIVVEIAEPGGLGEAERIIDADGRWVLPGFVDAHFHCRAPDHPEREDFASGTSAAAAGGATTILEMPVADVGISSVERFVARRALAESQAVIDFGLLAGCGSLSQSEINGLATAGAVGFKVFTHRPGPGREASFDGLWLTENSELLTALELVRDTGLPCAFHAEDDSLLDFYAQRDEGSSTPTQRYRDSRPPAVEAMAVARLAILAEASEARVHIVHVTSEWALDLIRASRMRGARLTAETCPHYLFFTDRSTQEVGVWAKVAPPLRAATDSAALIGGIEDGTIEVVCSDHAPFAEADREGVDIMEAPSGVPGVEIFAHLVLDAALRGQLELATVVRSLTAGPARLYGLYPQKGALLVGSDADFVVYDPHEETTVRIAGWISRSRASARLFEGRKYRGQVKMTFVRGQPVYADGKVLGQRGYGRMVRPHTPTGIEHPSALSGALNSASSAPAG